MIKIILATPRGANVIGVEFSVGRAHDVIRRSIHMMYPDDNSVVWKLRKLKNVCSGQAFLEH